MVEKIIDLINNTVDISRKKVLIKKEIYRFSNRYFITCFILNFVLLNKMLKLNCHCFRMFQVMVLNKLWTYIQIL